MARYTEASCRQCRREGMKLYLKGERCYSTNKCAFERRPTPPGQHGKRRTKLSEYGLQLREKQKGITGSNLLEILETRLDNVVYRLGLATSRKEARQLVQHAHFLVNGKKVNVPSYLIKEGDTIEVKAKSKKSPKFKEILEATENRAVAPWLSADLDTLSGKVIGRPTREDIDVEIAEHLIVELYSK